MENNSSPFGHMTLVLVIPKNSGGPLSKCKSLLLANMGARGGKGGGRVGEGGRGKGGTVRQKGRRRTGEGE